MTNGRNLFLKDSRKNNQIQVLRALFCFVIIFYHYSTRYSQLFNISSVFTNNVFEYLSHFGITSFFILSGFFLIRRQKVFLTPKQKIIYWLKRFLKLYIPYLIAVLIIFLLSFTGLYGAERTVSFSAFIENFFFVNLITGHGNVDGAHWYIFALITLLFLTFIYDLLPKKNKEWIFYWFVFLIISIISSVLLRTIENNAFITQTSKYVTFFLCRGYFPYCFIGIAVYLFDFEKIKQRNNVVVLIAFLLSIIYIASDNWVYLLLLLLSLALIVCCLFRVFAFLEKIKVLVLLGDASYSIYLTHQNIGYMFLNIFNDKINYYISIPIVMIIMVIFGLLFWLVIEKNTKRIIALIGNHKTV